MSSIARTATDTSSTPNPKPQKQTAAEAIAANVKALIEQLEQGHSEALTAYLTAMGRFHNYSFGNILEIARQKPDATRVAGIYAWNRLGRKVKKGERGIRILAPLIGIRRKKDEEAERDITTQNERVLVGFRNVYVFDVSQTEGAELPELSTNVTGSVGDYHERLMDFVIQQGIELEFKDSIAPALGVSYGGKIVLLPGQTTAEEFTTLVHELAHEMLHKAERRTATTKTVEHNVLLLLKQAPFNKRDAQLVPDAGSCVDCPKRTGHNKLLFADISGDSDACIDPICYAAKLDAHVKAKVAAKPELVQISTAYKQQAEGEKAIPRNKYVEIREEKPDTPEKAKWPEFKTCKYTAEAIVSDGMDKGEMRKVCTEPTCPVHHPKKQISKGDASFKAEQEKRRREEALANATGIRVLQSIVAAVPVRLMKRDIAFIAEQVLSLLDEKRQDLVARNRSIKAKGTESAAKLIAAFIRKADEGTIGKLIIEMVILLSARTQADGSKTLRAAAQAYGVDVDAVALKVKQEFAAKEKAKKVAKPEQKPATKAKGAA